MDEHIKKYVPKTKSYVRDTQHFISRLKQLRQIPEGALLVTLDVSSLYTNILNHEGLLAVANHQRGDPEKQNRTFRTKTTKTRPLPQRLSPALESVIMEN